MKQRTSDGPRGQSPALSLPVEVIRSTRRVKTISVQVREGRVIVRAPANVTEQLIQEFLREKKPQIEQWMTQHRNSQVLTPWYEHPLLLAGAGRQLHFSPGIKWSFELTPDALNITGPAKTLSDDTVKLALIEWLRQLAVADLRQRVKFWARQTRIPYEQVRIKDQSSRWGSCSAKGNLNLNWRLIMAPPRVADYVVVHELCHRLEMNHSPEFWRHVANWFPDYQSSRAWLKKHGQTLYF